MKVIASVATPGLEKDFQKPNNSSDFFAGGRVITKREAECLQLLAEGNSNRAIAALLSIGEPTVAMHIKNARKRLGARPREHAIAIALTRGLIAGLALE